MSRRTLEIMRWTLSACAIACVFFVLLRPGYPEGGWGVLLFFGFVILSAPAAMLTLHLHPPKWMKPKPEKPE